MSIFPYSPAPQLSGVPPHVGTSWSWQDIGRRALARSRRVAVPSFMHGPSRSTVGGLAHEEAGAAMNYESQLGARVDEISRFLDTVEAVNVFLLVINPCDFAQSVENIYHLSFVPEFSLEDFERVGILDGGKSMDIDTNVLKQRFSGKETASVIASTDGKGKCCVGSRDRMKQRFTAGLSMAFLICKDVLKQ
ncbi:hypothetical protein DFJ58DRAFT_413601 [Suillus subalutaceus]|uniref:uncharacterized protein n=1 Tax=Suillus subalutaceus TaxID=48586 RepID=UPI001B879242|nr:uncharacterized protein DFJ58DRAFT_413601 [Suillus subalutaceus]KAG1852249.1 hypothetical protein DFJ58DRAFT_413601 [Suillus subalutaceus]